MKFTADVKQKIFAEVSEFKQLNQVFICEILQQLSRIKKPEVINLIKTVSALTEGLKQGKNF